MNLNIENKTMKQYISKSDLVAEIENRRDSFYSLSESCEKGTPAKAGFYAQAQTLEGILSFINTLEVKEADLDNDIKNAFKAGYELGIQQKTQKGE